MESSSLNIFSGVQLAYCLKKPGAVYVGSRRFLDLKCIWKQARENVDKI